MRLSHGGGLPCWISGFRFCTCMKGWHMSRESSLAGKLHQGMGADFAPARFRICAARVAGTCHGNPASQTAAGRKLHQGSPLRFLCRMRWPEVRASEKHHFSAGGPWKALKAPEVGGPWRQRPFCSVGLHKMMAHAYRKQMDL